MDNLQSTSLEEKTKKEVEGVKQFLKPKNKEKILDLPCGYARHSIEFALEGYEVTGIDIDSFLLQEGNARLNQSKFQNSHKNLKLIQADMRKINIKKEYTTLINLNCSFGYFEEDENEKILLKFYKALTDDGQLIISTDVSPEIIENKNYENLGAIQKRIKPTKIYFLQKEYPEAKLFIWETYNASEKRIHGLWQIKELNGYKTKKYPYSVRIYSAEELKKLCKEIGFKKVEAYGSWSKQFFSGKEKELIIRAIK